MQESCAKLFHAHIFCLLFEREGRAVVVAGASGQENMEALVARRRITKNVTTTKNNIGTLLFAVKITAGCIHLQMAALERSFQKIVR